MENFKINQSWMRSLFIIEENLFLFFKIMLCLVLEKFERKCEGKKIKRKSRRKEKVKENKK